MLHLCWLFRAEYAEEDSGRIDYMEDSIYNTLENLFFNFSYFIFSGADYYLAQLEELSKSFSLSTAKFQLGSQYVDIMKNTKALDDQLIVVLNRSENLSKLNSIIDNSAMSRAKKNDAKDYTSGGLTASELESLNAILTEELSEDATSMGEFSSLYSDCYVSAMLDCMDGDSTRALVYTLLVDFQTRLNSFVDLYYEYIYDLMDVQNQLNNNPTGTLQDKKEKMELAIFLS